MKQRYHVVRVLIRPCVPLFTSELHSLHKRMLRLAGARVQGFHIEAAVALEQPEHEDTTH